MKEDFLQYVWKFQKFDSVLLETTTGEPVEVVKPGLQNFDSGPDFFNGAVRINGQQWVGNIEIHLLSSLWYAHRHDSDPAYDNVVLHVVWQHDRVVFRRDDSEIPTIELQHRVPARAVSYYQRLHSGMHRWIPCESEFSSVEDFTYHNWLEYLFIERMERRYDSYLDPLNTLKNDWEALLFRELCISFGTKVNKEAFANLAASVDFSLVRKLSREGGQLESFFLGQAGLLEQDNGDDGYLEFRNDYLFLKRKFGLDNAGVIPPKFFRLRPLNFPTIRLSQLARIYEKHPVLFSEILEITTAEQFYELLEVSAGTYWEEHFSFGKKHKRNVKSLSRTFKEHLLVNVVIPVKFSYMRQNGSASDEDLLFLARQLSPEKNSIITKFAELGRKPANILESQGLLHLKKVYCDTQQCLRCAIGNAILK